MDLGHLIQTFSYLPIVPETIAVIQQSGTVMNVLSYPDALLNQLIKAQGTTKDQYVGAVTIHDHEKCVIYLNTALPLVIQMTLLMHEWMHVIDYELIFIKRKMIEAEERAYAHQARFVSQLRNTVPTDKSKRVFQSEFESWAQIHRVLTLETGSEELQAQLSYLKTDFSEFRKSKRIDQSA